MSYYSVMGKTTNESLWQDMFVTTAEERKMHPNRGKEKATKEKKPRLFNASSLILKTP